MLADVDAFKTKLTRTRESGPEIRDAAEKQGSDDTVFKNLLDILQVRYNFSELLMTEQDRRGCGAVLA